MLWNLLRINHNIMIAYRESRYEVYNHLLFNIITYLTEKPLQIYLHLLSIINNIGQLTGFLTIYLTN